ncbi:MAG: hypothetical protein ACI8UO_004063 [Verrucomicrobiales bacterium]|jgi:hypothetical protein
MAKVHWAEYLRQAYLPDNVEQLLAAWEERRAANPGNADPILAIAILHYRLGQQDRAWAVLDEAVKVGAENPGVVFWELVRAERESSRVGRERVLELSKKSALLDETGKCAANAVGKLRTYGRFDEAAEIALAAPLDNLALESAAIDFAEFGDLETAAKLAEKLGNQPDADPAQAAFIRGFLAELDDDTDAAITAYLDACQDFKPAPPESDEIQDLPQGTRLLLGRAKRMSSLSDPRIRGRVVQAGSWSAPRYTLSTSAGEKLNFAARALGRLESIALKSDDETRDRIWAGLEAAGFPVAIGQALSFDSATDATGEFPKDEAIQAWSLLSRSGRTDYGKLPDFFEENFPNLAFLAAAHTANSADETKFAALRDRAIEIGEIVAAPDKDGLEALLNLNLSLRRTWTEDQRTRIWKLIRNWSENIPLKASQFARVLDSAPDGELAEILNRAVRGPRRNFVNSSSDLNRAVFPPIYAGGLGEGISGWMSESVSGRLRSPDRIREIPLTDFESPDLRLIAAHLTTDATKIDQQLLELTADEATPETCLFAAAYVMAVRKDFEQCFEFCQRGLEVSGDDEAGQIQQLLKWRIVLAATVPNPPPKVDGLREAAIEIVSEGISSPNPLGLPFENHRHRFGLSELRRWTTNPVPGWRTTPLTGFGLESRIKAAKSFKRFDELAGLFAGTLRRYAPRWIESNLAPTEFFRKMDSDTHKYFSEPLNSNEQSFDAALKLLEPDADDSIRDRIYFAAVCEMTGKPERSLEIYEEALDASPQDDLVRQRVIRLIFDDKPAEAAAHVAALRSSRDIRNLILPAVTAASPESQIKFVGALSAEPNQQLLDENLRRWVVDVFWKRFSTPPLATAIFSDGSGASPQDRRQHEAICRAMLEDPVLSKFGLYALTAQADADGRTLGAEIWPALKRSLLEFDPNDSIPTEFAIPFRALRRVLSHDRREPVSLTITAARLAIEHPEIDDELWNQVLPDLRANPKTLFKARAKTMKRQLELLRCDPAEFVDLAAEWRVPAANKLDSNAIFNAWRLRSDEEIDMTELTNELLDAGGLEITRFPRHLFDTDRVEEALQFIQKSMGRVVAKPKQIELLRHYASVPEFSWEVYRQAKQIGHPISDILAELTFLNEIKDERSAWQLLESAPFWKDPEEFDMMLEPAITPVDLRWRSIDLDSGLEIANSTLFEAFAQRIAEYLSKNKKSEIPKLLDLLTEESFGGALFSGVVRVRSYTISFVFSKNLESIKKLPPERLDALLDAFAANILADDDPIARAWLIDQFGADWAKEDADFLASTTPPEDHVLPRKLYWRAMSLDDWEKAKKVLDHALALQPEVYRPDFAKAIFDSLAWKSESRRYIRHLRYRLMFDGIPGAPSYTISDARQLGERWLLGMRLRQDSIDDRVRRIVSALRELGEVDLGGDDDLRRGLLVMFFSKAASTDLIDSPTRTAMLAAIEPMLAVAGEGRSTIRDFHAALKFGPHQIAPNGKVDAYFASYLGNRAWPIERRAAILSAIPSKCEASDEARIQIGLFAAESFKSGSDDIKSLGLFADVEKHGKEWLAAAREVQKGWEGFLGFKRADQYGHVGSTQRVILGIHGPLGDVAAIERDLATLNDKSYRSTFEQLAIDGNLKAAEAFLRLTWSEIPAKQDYHSFNQEMHEASLAVAEHIEKSNPALACLALAIFNARYEGSNQAPGLENRASRMEAIADRFLAAKPDEPELRKRIIEVLSLEPAAAAKLIEIPEMRIAEFFEIAAALKPELSELPKAQQMLIQAIQNGEVEVIFEISQQARNERPLLKEFWKEISAFYRSKSRSSLTSIDQEAWAVLVGATVGSRIAKGEKKEALGVTRTVFAAWAKADETKLMRPFFTGYRSFEGGVLDLLSREQENLDVAGVEWAAGALTEAKRVGSAWNSVDDIRSTLDWIDQACRGIQPDWVVVFWLHTALAENSWAFEKEAISWASGEQKAGRDSFAIQQLLAAGNWREDLAVGKQIAWLKNPDWPVQLRRELISPLGNHLGNNNPDLHRAGALAFTEILEERERLNRSDDTRLFWTYHFYNFLRVPRDGEWRNLARRIEAAWTQHFERNPDAGLRGYDLQHATLFLLKIHLALGNEAGFEARWPQGAQHFTLDGQLMFALWSKRQDRVAACLESWDQLKFDYTTVSSYHWPLENDAAARETIAAEIGKIARPDLKLFVRAWAAHATGGAGLPDLAKQFSETEFQDEDLRQATLRALCLKVEAAAILNEAGALKKPAAPLETSVEWEIWLQFLALSGQYNELDALVPEIEPMPSETGGVLFASVLHGLNSRLETMNDALEIRRLARTAEPVALLTVNRRGRGSGIFPKTRFWSGSFGLAWAVAAANGEGAEFKERWNDLSSRQGRVTLYRPLVKLLELEAASAERRHRIVAEIDEVIGYKERKLSNLGRWFAVREGLLTAKEALALCEDTPKDNERALRNAAEIAVLASDHETALRYWEAAIPLTEPGSRESRSAITGAAIARIRIREGN